MHNWPFADNDDVRRAERMFWLRLGKGTGESSGLCNTLIPQAEKWW
jgi:hypothetical protein